MDRLGRPNIGPILELQRALGLRKMKGHSRRPGRYAPSLASRTGAERVRARVRRGPNKLADERMAKVSVHKSELTVLGARVLKDERKWTDDDVNRLLSLKLVICQQVKPKETAKLYGVKQRLSAMRLRLDGSIRQHQQREMIERIPPVTAGDCTFLSGVLTAVLNGERDAYKAFGLAVLDRNPPNPRTPFMAAEYELCKRIYPKPLHKAARSQIAARYRVSDARVSQARSKIREGN